MATASLIVNDTTATPGRTYSTAADSGQTQADMLLNPSGAHPDDAASIYTGSLPSNGMSLSDTPANTGIISSATLVIRHKTWGFVNDSVQLSAQIVKSDTTALTSAVVVRTGVFWGDVTDTIAFTGISGNTKQLWDNCKIKLTQTVTANMGADTNCGTIVDWLRVDLVTTETGPPVTITQSDYCFYGDGTESGSTALAAVNTTPSVDINADANVQLRMRLQSTTATAVDSANDFQLQYEKNSSGSWNNVISTGAEALLTSYSETNYVNASTLTTTGVLQRYAQSFIGDGKSLTKAGWWAAKANSPTGNVVMELYAHSGTFGTSSVPTGDPLVTSTPIESSTLSTTLSWVEFTFPGYTLENGVPYCIAIRAIGAGITGTNTVRVGWDDTAGTAAGNSAYYSSSAWASDPSDSIFRVYTAAMGANVLPYNSPNLTDGGPTTNRLGSGSGSFVTGKLSEDGLIDDLGWTGNNFTEVVYSLKMLSADLTSSDTLKFRILRNGAVLDSYAQTPTIGFVTGPKIVTGTCALVLNLDITASGARVPLLVTGTSALSLNVNVVAAGTPIVPTVIVTGTSIVALNVNAIAVGTNFKIVTGQVAVQIDVNVVVQGTVIAEIVTGTSVLQLGISSTTTGTRIVCGTSVLPVSINVVTTGTVIAEIVTGTAVLQLGIIVVAQGTVIAEVVTGISALQLDLVIAAQGIPVTAGVTTGTSAIALDVLTSAIGTVIGAPVTTGTAAIALSIVSTTTGTRLVNGTSVKALSLTTIVIGTRITLGTSVAQVAINVVAVGTVITVPTGVGGMWGTLVFVEMQYESTPVVDWSMLGV